jgi:hypothetical protein
MIKLYKNSIIFLSISLKLEATAYIFYFYNWVKVKRIKIQIDLTDEFRAENLKKAVKKSIDDLNSITKWK